MDRSERVGALLLMGGEGRRLGGSVPKQFQRLGSASLYLYALETFLRSQLFDEVVLVCHPEWMEATLREVPAGVGVVPAGGTRQQSAYEGLKGFREPPAVVVLHDAVRPFVTEAILRENVEGALRVGAIDTCIPSADTLVRAPGGKTIRSIPRRADYLRGQTPQTFRYEVILAAHERARALGIVDATDDCQLVLAAGQPVGVVLGSEENFKVTSERDLRVAEWMVAQNFSRWEKMACCSAPSKSSP